jgi:geranylgeranyl diphosphate synthase type II
VTYKVGLLGLGTVGTGVAKIFQDSTGRHPLLPDIEIARVGVRSQNKQRDVAIESSIVTEDLDAIVNDPAIDIVVEVIGGIEPAKSLILKAIANLGHAVAATGLVGGQVVDLECEGKQDVTAETLTFIHIHKTAALLESCVICGALLAGANDTDIKRLSTYANNIGLAFQIIDDILDITATSEQLGKTAGKDLTAQKVTYPSLWGIEASQQKAQELVEQAKAQLVSYGDAALPLMALADYITARKN